MDTARHPFDHTAEIPVNGSGEPPRAPANQTVHLDGITWDPHRQRWTRGDLAWDDEGAAWVRSEWVRTEPPAAAASAPPHGWPPAPPRPPSPRAPQPSRSTALLATVAVAALLLVVVTATFALRRGGSPMAEVPPIRPAPTTTTRPPTTTTTEAPTTTTTRAPKPTPTPARSGNAPCDTSAQRTGTYQAEIVVCSAENPRFPGPVDNTFTLYDDAGHVVKTESVRANLLRIRDFPDGTYKLVVTPAAGHHVVSNDASLDGDQTATRLTFDQRAATPTVVVTFFVEQDDDSPTGAGKGANPSAGSPSPPSCLRVARITEPSC